MGPFLKRLGLITAKVFGALLLILIIVLGTIFYRPEILISPTSLYWALNRFAPQVQFSAKNLQISSESKSFWSKHFSISAQDLCVKLSEPHDIDFCAASVELEIPLDFTWFQLQFPKPPRVSILGGKLYVTLKESPPLPQDAPLIQWPIPSFDGVFGGLQELLPGQDFGDIQIEILALAVRVSKDFETSGALRLQPGPQKSSLTLASDLEIKSTSLKKPLPVQLRSDLNLQRKIWTANLSASNFHRSQLALKLSDVLLLDLRAEVMGKPAKIDLQSQIKIQKQLIDIQTKAQVRLFRPPFLKSEKINLPRIDVKQSAQIKYQISPESYEFQIAAEVATPSLSGIGLDLKAAADLTYTRQMDWDKQFVPRSLNATARIPDFQKIANEIRWTRFQIPAPFYRLKGPVELKVDGQNFSQQKGELALQLRTDLKDGLQAIQIEAPGTLVFERLFSPQRKLRLQSEVLIHQLRIELPRLSILNLPTLKMDSRFSSTKAAPPPQPSMNWSVHLKLKTPKDPVVLFSNLLNQPLKLNLDQQLVLGSKLDTAFTGLTQVQTMDVELFRRIIRVENFDFNRQNSRVTQLNGLFSFANSEVKVRIRLLGTTSAPQIVWESDPPLSQRQIISIIVFGKSLNELTQAETSSAQNLERAFSDGALGIASLFLLASTPIESVSYDPITGTYAARLKVDGKTSLSLGSDFEDRQSLSLRRQLGGAWSINTELESRTDKQDHVSTFLEWFRRF